MKNSSGTNFRASREAAGLRDESRKNSSGTTVRASREAAGLKDESRKNSSGTTDRTSNEALIRLEGITKHYLMGGETIRALDGVDLSIEKNEYIAFIGSSGSGKSTMMNILGCLDTPSTGRYCLNGRDVASMAEDELATTRNREIGFIFQSFNLLPRMNALQNVMQPLVYRGLRPAAREAKAREALQRVGLGQRLDHRPSQLSGGQRQRVAIARALAGEPSILLADEPTGNLDSATTAEIMALFDRLHRDGHTLVLVTHEPEIAEHCRRAVRLADGRVLSDKRNSRQELNHVQPA